MLSPVTYFGGKSKLAGRILELVPAHRTFVDVFGGSGAVLLAKPRTGIEVYNDIDGQLVNLFRVIRDPQLSEKLSTSLEHTPYSREEFTLAKAPTDDAVEGARRFMVRQVQSRMGLGDQWSYSRSDSSGSIARKWHRRIAALPEIRERFRNVQIENLDWRDVIDRYDSPGTHFYLDPPYPTETRVGGTYKHEFTDTRHRELMARILVLKGTATLSGYQNALYRPLERAGWHRTDFRVMANCSDARTMRTESVWTSVAALTRCEKSHRTQRANTTKKILDVIAKMEANGERVNFSELARRTKRSRDHLSRYYRQIILRHLYPSG